jgi:hypothetical protein
MWFIFGTCRPVVGKVHTGNAKSGWKRWIAVSSRKRMFHAFDTEQASSDVNEKTSVLQEISASKL